MEVIEMMTCLLVLSKNIPKADDIWVHDEPHRIQQIQEILSAPVSSRACRHILGNGVPRPASFHGTKLYELNQVLSSLVNKFKCLVCDQNDFRQTYYLNQQSFGIFRDKYVRPAINNINGQHTYDEITGFVLSKLYNDTDYRFSEIMFGTNRNY